LRRCKKSHARTFCSVGVPGVVGDSEAATMGAVRLGTCSQEDMKMATLLAVAYAMWRLAGNHNQTVLR